MSEQNVAQDDFFLVKVSFLFSGPSAGSPEPTRRSREFDKFDPGCRERRRERRTAIHPRVRQEANLVCGQVVIDERISIAEVVGMNEAQFGAHIDTKSCKLWIRHVQREHEVRRSVVCEGRNALQRGVMTKHMTELPGRECNLQNRHCSDSQSGPRTSIRTSHDATE